MPVKGRQERKYKGSEKIKRLGPEELRAAMQELFGSYNYKFIFSTNLAVTIRTIDIIYFKYGVVTDKIGHIHTP